MTDPSVAAVMLASAAVNAVGEELLWRGTFIELVPDDTGRGATWSLLWFALWHLAPQLILPSRIGRWRFVWAPRPWVAPRRSPGGVAAVYGGRCSHTR